MHFFPKKCIINAVLNPSQRVFLMSTPVNLNRPTPLNPIGLKSRRPAPIHSKQNNAFAGSTDSLPELHSKSPTKKPRTQFPSIAPLRRSISCELSPGGMKSAVEEVLASVNSTPVLPSPHLPPIANFPTVPSNTIPPSKNSPTRRSNPTPVEKRTAIVFQKRSNPTPMEVYRDHEFRRMFYCQF